MSKFDYKALIALTLLAGCTASTGTIGDTSAPLSSFAIEGPEGLSFQVEVLAVERTPALASYQVTVEGERYALAVRDSAEGITAEVQNAAGTRVLSGERHGGTTRVTDHGAIELEASGEPIEVDVATMAGLDPYAMTLLTDGALRALAHVQPVSTAGDDELGVHTAALIWTGTSSGFIVWRSKCSASCPGASCSITRETGTATCRCVVFRDGSGGCERYCRR